VEADRKEVIVSAQIRCLACLLATAGRIACFGTSAHGAEPISPELIQEYEDAGGISATFRAWADDGLCGRVPGFHFDKEPTRELPALPVPFGLILHRSL